MTKRLPNHAYEALECLGGGGYVEEGPHGALYREAPVNAIWEGSGNVNALDVLRALAREPRHARGLARRRRRGARERARPSTASSTASMPDLADLGDAELFARRLVEDMALALQASLMLRHAPPALAKPSSRRASSGGMRGCYGALPPGLALDAIIERARIR